METGKKRSFVNKNDIHNLTLLMKDYHDDIFTKSKSAEAVRAKEAAWEELTDRYNSMTTNQKTKKQLRDVWRNQKSIQRIKMEREDKNQHRGCSKKMKKIDEEANVDVFEGIVEEIVTCDENYIIPPKKDTLKMKSEGDKERNCQVLSDDEMDDFSGETAHTIDLKAARYNLKAQKEKYEAEKERHQAEIYNRVARANEAEISKLKLMRLRTVLSGHE